MNKIKLLAIDLDNTLLNDKKTISQQDREALRRCLENGIDIVIASGRFLDSHKRLVEEIGLDLEGQVHIAEGGGLIYQKDKKTFLGQIEQSKYLEVLSKLKEAGITPFVSDGRYVYYETLGPLNNIYGKDTKTDDSFLREIKDLREVDRPLKFIIHWDENSDLNDIEKLIDPSMKAFVSAKMIAEITSRDLDKWIALEKIMDQKNIKAEEVAAFGDSGNDLEMIKNSGLGLAVSNSLEEVKKAADHVSEKDNNHSAVSELIYKYILC